MNLHCSETGYKAQFYNQGLNVPKIGPLRNSSLIWYVFHNITDSMS